MKKFLKVLMSCLVTCMVVQPLYAYADTIYTEGYLKYVLEGESISICGYFGSEKEVTIPSTIAGYPVSKIAKGAFNETNTVKKVILPDTIMTIEEGAIGPDMTVVYDGNIERVPDKQETSGIDNKPVVDKTTETTKKEDSTVSTKPETEININTTGNTDEQEVFGEEIIADFTEETAKDEENTSEDNQNEQDDYIYESQTIPYETMDTKKSGIGKTVAMIAIPVIAVGAGVAVFFFTNKRKK